MARNNIIKRIISSPIIQTILIYISGGWIALELTDYIINKYGLNEKISDVLPLILLIGLPVAIILAWYLSREREETKGLVEDKAPYKRTAGIFRTIWKRRWFSIPGLLILILLAVTCIRYLHRQAKTRWAREEALPQIEYLIKDNNFSAAFPLVTRARRYIADDPEFKEWASYATAKVTILSEPSGAEVYIKEYGHPDNEWEFLGETPIDSIELPNVSFYQMRFEKAGYETVLAVAATSYDTLFRTLFKANTVPPGMVYVEGYWDEVKDLFLSDQQGFFMDRFEVTNRKYKEFVDQGGYSNPQFWNHEFLKDGVTISREEAMAVFTDKTGRAGPSTWEASDYPDGLDDYPVSGVSWYEAAAYAKWAGKELPTGGHWDSGAGLYLPQFERNFGSKLIPNSNFNGKGPEPVGKCPGINIFGAFDLAGNVREWCWNSTGNLKIISGAAWNDADYLYYYWHQLPPFDRSPENGFRCVKYIDPQSIPSTAFRQIDFPITRDYSKEDPVSDQVFDIYRNQFLYDSIDLEAVVEEKDESHEDWTLERITFNAAYNKERVIALLYLPVNAAPPYQIMIYFPGISAIWEEEVINSNYTEFLIDYIVKSGRVIMVPVYKGTWERNDGLTARMSDANTSHEYKDWLIKWVKDFSRSIDYLESRSDMDTSKIGFIGWSWGGEVGGIIPAVENRLKVTVLYVGGFTGNTNPEVNIVNYLPRINIPFLMLNGRYDYYRPYEKNLKPFYNLLGTPTEDKYLLLYETGHFVPKHELIKETLTFLDQYLGTVNR